MILFLEIGAKMKRALLEEDVGFLERIYLMWYSHFFFQQWLEWWKSPLNPYPKNLRTYCMPPIQLLDTVEIAANNLALLIRVMAEYYPDFPLLPETATTSKLENLFSSVRNSGDCKSSNTFEEVLWKLRNSVAKESCKAKLVKCSNVIKPNRSRFPQDPFPNKIPNLKEQVIRTIDSAKTDLTDRVKDIFFLPHQNTTGQFERNQDDEMFLSPEMRPQWTSQDVSDEEDDDEVSF